MARRFTRLSQNDILNPQRHKYQLDRMMTDLETAFSGVDTAIAALAAAVAAQSDATTALANAATVKRDDKITGVDGHPRERPLGDRRGL
jgi:DNA-binding sugar fermentation-stimulating protein